MLGPDSRIDPRRRIGTIGDDTTHPKMPVPRIFPVELHKSRSATNPFARLWQLVHDVISQQFAESSPITLLSAFDVTAHTRSGPGCPVHDRTLTTGTDKRDGPKHRTVPHLRVDALPGAGDQQHQLGVRAPASALAALLT